MKVRKFLQKALWYVLPAPMAFAVAKRFLLKPNWFSEGMAAFKPSDKFIILPVFSVLDLMRGDRYARFIEDITKLYHAVQAQNGCGDGSRSFQTFGVPPVDKDGKPIPQ